MITKTPSSNNIKDHVTVILFVGMIVFFVALSFLWIIKDTLPPPWDQASYLEQSERLYYSLTDHGVLSFAKDFATIATHKAPLITAIPILPYLILGNSELSAMVGNLVFMILLYVFLFLLAKQLLKSNLAALVTVFVAATMPYLFSIYRLFSVEGGLTTLVVLFIYLLVASDAFRKTKYVLWIGVTTGLGLLMKTLFPLFIIGPFLVICWKRIAKDKQKVGALTKPIALIAMVGFAIASIWYIPNILSMTAWIFNAGFGSLAKDYSIGSVFDIRTIGLYWSYIISFDVSFYYSALTVLFIVAMVLLYRRNIGTILKQDLYPLSIIASWFFIPLIIFTLGVNKDIRFMLPAIPAIALFIGYVINKITTRMKYFRFIFVSIVFIFPLWNFLYSSFDLHALGAIAQVQSVDWGPFIIIRKDTGRTRPPVQQYWPQKEILSFIANDVERYPLNIRAMTIVDHPYFNINNFRYYNYLYGFKTITVNTNAYYPENIPLETVLEDIRKREYLIGKTGNQGPDFSTYRNETILKMLADRELSFVLVKMIDLPDGTEGLVYRNTALGS